ncbi:hypothetical protein [Caldiplasma sukawensis]
MMIFLLISMFSVIPIFIGKRVEDSVKYKKYSRTYVINAPVEYEDHLFVSEKYGIGGRPSTVRRDERTLIPEIYVHSESGGEPNRYHIMLMGSYFIAIEDSMPDDDVEYGVIYYEDCLFVVDNNQYLKSVVISTKSAIERMKKLKDFHRTNQDPNVCYACKFQQICTERLI